MKVKKIINLTPHAIHILGKEGEVLRTYPSQGAIRLAQQTINLEPAEDGTPLTKTQYLDGALPEPQEGTIYIVSLPVAQYALTKGRKDFVVPNDLVRDDEGRIIGCKNLAFIE